MASTECLPSACLPASLPSGMLACKLPELFWSLLLKNITQTDVHPDSLGSCRSQKSWSMYPFISHFM